MKKTGKYANEKLKFHLSSEFFRFLMRLTFVILTIIIAHSKLNRFGIFSHVDIRVSFAQIRIISTSILVLRNTMHFFVEHWNDIDLKFLASGQNDFNKEESINKIECLTIEINSSQLFLSIPNENSQLNVNDFTTHRISDFTINIGDSVVFGGNIYLRTVMINTLLGLSPYSGSLKMGSEEIKYKNRNEIYSKISYMPFDQIFKRTIIDNICYGSGLSKEKAIDEIKRLGFDRYFKVLKNGYYTKVGSKNYGISCGQRQLISFLRCVLKNAEIYIFNEPLIYLDQEMKEKVMKTILNFKNKTVIVVSNDTKYYSEFNKVILI